MPAIYKLCPLEADSIMVALAFAGKVEQQDFNRQRIAREMMAANYKAMVEPCLAIDLDAMQSAAYADGCKAARQKPLTPRQYNAIPELCAINPSLYESIVRAIERAHGITA